MNKPNVVLIIADQWPTKHGNGSDHYPGLKTPAIDCLTGLLPQHNNLYDNPKSIVSHPSGYQFREDIDTLNKELDNVLQQWNKDSNMDLIINYNLEYGIY